MAIHLGRLSPGASSNQPGRRCGNAFRSARGRASVPSLFGFAPGGVYLAAPVASRAVRSYRTLSPLLSQWAYRALRYLRPSGPPCAALGSGKRFAFCGTVPGVAPAGRYPAPCFRGARTFLHLESASTANGHSAPPKQRPSGQLARYVMAFRFIPSRALDGKGPNLLRQPAPSQHPSLAGLLHPKAASPVFWI